MRYFLIFIILVFSLTYYILTRPYDKVHTGIVLNKTINYPTIINQHKHSNRVTSFSLGVEYVLLVDWEEGFKSWIYVDKNTYNSYEVNNLIQINYDIYKTRNKVFLIVGIGVLGLLLAFYILYKLENIKWI